MCEKERVEGEQPVLTAMALLEEVILGQRQQNLKENQDAIRINEVAVLGINETNKIRELYRVLGEIPENGKGKNVNKMQEA